MYPWPPALSKGYVVVNSSHDTTCVMSFASTKISYLSVLSAYPDVDIDLAEPSPSPPTNETLPRLVSSSMYDVVMRFSYSSEKKTLSLLSVPS